MINRIPLNVIALTAIVSLKLFGATTVVDTDLIEFAGKEPEVGRWSPELDKVMQKCAETGYPALCFFCNAGCYWCNIAKENALDETAFKEMISSYKNIYPSSGVDARSRRRFSASVVHRDSEEITQQVTAYIALADGGLATTQDISSICKAYRKHWRYQTVLSEKQTSTRRISSQSAYCLLSRSPCSA